MNQQNDVVYAPGASAKEKNCALNFQSFTAAKRRKRQLQRFLRTIPALILLLTLSLSSAIAQNYDTLYTSNLGFTVTGPTHLLKQGETVTLDIKVGTALNPVINAHEIDIPLDISEDAVFPTSPEIQTTDSWFFTGGSHSYTVSTDQANRVITVEGGHTTPQSGEGTLFQISLEVAGDGIFAADLISDGGGLVLVDNLGFRVARPEALEPSNFEPALYPNPCQDQLQVDWQDGNPVSLSLYNQQGNRVLFQKVGGKQAGTYSVGQLPRGVYIAIIQYPDAQITKKILLH